MIFFDSILQKIILCLQRIDRSGINLQLECPVIFANTLKRNIQKLFGHTTNYKMNVKYKRNFDGPIVKFSTNS